MAPMSSPHPSGPPAPPSDGGGLRAVQSYYNETWLDYRMMWMNRINRSIHFGYWDENTRNHSESLLNTNRVLVERAQFKAGELALDAGFERGPQSPASLEHDVAAVEQRPGLLQAEALGQVAEVGHRDLAVGAEIHRSQERDV